MFWVEISISLGHVSILEWWKNCLYPGHLAGLALRKSIGGGAAGSFRSGNDGFGVWMVRGISLRLILVFLLMFSACFQRGRSSDIYVDGEGEVSGGLIIMPRGPRLDAKGALHHVMVRGWKEGRSSYWIPIERS